MANKEAWVTLATNDSYAVGALVLANSLKLVNSAKPLVVMISDQVSPSMRERLGEVSCLVQQVNVMDSQDSAHLALLARPELGITFTKLHCWTLTDFSKCVFLDADTLVIRNCDELFDREELSAASDAGWPDCFNSGVFVYKPSMETYGKLIDFAIAQGSFDGGDQGLLNSYFSDWATKDLSRRLPFIYNMTASAVYSYRPAYKQFGGDVRIVHFIGSPKPWQASEVSAFQTPVAREHVGLWWDIFVSHVLPCLSTDMNRLVEQDYLPPPHTVETRWPSAHSDVASLVGGTTSLWQHRPNVAETTETDSVIPNQTASLTANVDIVSSSTMSSDPHQVTNQNVQLLVTDVLTPAIQSETIASDRTDQAEPPNTGVAVQFSQLVVDEEKQPATGATASGTSSQAENTVDRRQAWERGDIDYCGKDSFDNIMQKISKTLDTNKKA